MKCDLSPILFRHGVTLDDLRTQCDLFVETLRNKLNEDKNLTKPYILQFSGLLSQELIDFEIAVRKNERIPP